MAQDKRRTKQLPIQFDKRKATIYQDEVTPDLPRRLSKELISGNPKSKGDPPLLNKK